jgi:hypothetical protein
MPTAAYDAIADWYDALVRSDSFVGDQIREPQPTPAETVVVPGYRVIPAFMLVRCKKPSPWQDGL